MMSAVNIRQLQFFVALAREGHFGRAAAACNVSQPALSMAIGRLESELGLRLVDRGTGGMVGLTDAGQALIARARSVVQGVESVAGEAARLKGQLTGTLRLGTVPTAVTAVPALTAALLHEHPGVRVKARTAPSEVLCGDVMRYELDAALVYEKGPRSGLSYRPLYDERLMFVSPAADCDSDGTVPWTTVAEHELCLLSEPMQHRVIVEDAIRGVGGTVRPRVEADSFAMLMGYVRQGWPTVLGHTWLLGQRLPPGFCAREIVDPALQPRIALVTSIAGHPTPVSRALIETLTDVDVPARASPATPELSSVARGADQRHLGMSVKGY